MKILKFKAWHKAEKRFINLNGMSIAFGAMTDKGQVYGVTEQGVLREYDKDEIELIQFTGLKDKHEKDIFEGDIIKKVNQNLHGDKELNPSEIGDIYFVVKMSSGYVLCPIKYFGKLLKTYPDEPCPNVWGYIQNYDFWNGASTGAEIIGNIHQDKNLLK